MGPRRLYARIYLHLVGVLVVASLLSSAIYASGWRSMVVRGIAERLARHAAATVGRHLDDPAARERALRVVAEELDIDVTLRSPGGALLGAVGDPLPALDDGEAGRLGEGPTIVTHHGSHWFAAAPVMDTAGGARRAVLEASLGRRFRVPSPWRPIASVVGVLLLVAVATVPLARRISRPVELLTQATRRFGAGELAARVFECPHPRRRDELAELTRAWNDMAERIERLVRGHKELLANVSHELRSPLARIRMALELVPKDAASEKRLADVTADLGELERLIDDVLTASRLEAGGLPLRPARVDVAALFAELVARAEFDPLLEAKAVVAAPLAEPLAIVGDVALLKRALWNLVENAAKYGAPPIALSAARVGERVELRVDDEGPGIAPDERERVLEAFERLDRARTPGAGGGLTGFGLGLTIARRVAEVHHGRLRVEAARRDGERDVGCRLVIDVPAETA